MAAALGVGLARQGQGREWSQAPVGEALSGLEYTEGVGNVDRRLPPTDFAATPWWILFLLLLVVAVSDGRTVVAQSQVAALQGAVGRLDGSPLNGVTIRARRIETNEIFTLETDSSGTSEEVGSTLADHRPGRRPAEESSGKSAPLPRDLPGPRSGALQLSDRTHAQPQRLRRLPGGRANLAKRVRTSTWRIWVGTVITPKPWSRRCRDLRPRRFDQAG